MKALRLIAPNNLILKDVEQSNLRPGWTRIKVKSVGVCGSDLSSIAGKLPFTKYPITPGHEFSGIVTETNNTNKIKVDQFVTANPIFYCSLCSDCLAGNIHYCSQTEVLGVKSYNGAYAEEIVLPEHMLEPLPDNFSFDQGAMVEPVAVAVEVARKCDLKPESKVAIFGAGNIGLLLLQVVQSYSIRDILVIDPIEKRLHIAKKIGANQIKTPKDFEENPSQYINKYDLVIDGVGCQQTFSSAIELVATGGKIVVYGVPQLEPIPISALNLFKKNVSLVFSRLYPRSFKSAIALLGNGLINIDYIITHRITMKEFPALLTKMFTDKEEIIKVMINI